MLRCLVIVSDKQNTLAHVAEALLLFAVITYHMTFKLQVTTLNEGHKRLFISKPPSSQTCIKHSVYLDDSQIQCHVM